MSGATSRQSTRVGGIATRLVGPRILRGLALLGALALLASFLTVLYGVVDVAGRRDGYWLLVAASLAGATLLARWLRVAIALSVAGVLLSVGLAWYLLSLPYDPAFWAMIESNVELLSGQSVLQIRRAGVWALSVTPAPVFVTWYLALRRWYVAAAIVGGSMLGYLVLTGDASGTVPLLGLVGGAAMVGFGDLDRRDGTGAGAEYVALALAVMVVAPALVTVVPGGGGAVSIGGGGSGGGTLEASLLDTQGQFDIAGDISLSPKERFTVESERATYWQTETFDRYTGTGWTRTGGSAAYRDDRLSTPDGPTRRLVQTVRAETDVETMPAAWRPVSVGTGIADRTKVTDNGGIIPTDPIREGDEYRVVSRVPDPSTAELEQSGRDYPADILEDYTKYPSSTPDRVARRTAEVTADADGPYETALAIEAYLERTKEYSLSVDAPDDHVADAFLFEMEAGYCTYYATTMAVMLRTQDIPARVAVGYTSGEEVGDDQYLVRGLDAHAWVEVYVEDVGWVRFDPTPAEPRRQRERAEIRQSRRPMLTDDGEAGQSSTPTPTPTPTPTATPEGPTPTPTPAVTGFDGNVPGPQTTAHDAGGALELPELPPREQLALGVVLLAGLVAGVRRSGVARWAVRSAALRWQPRRDPATDVERAYRRLAILLERRHRPRRPDETVREYLDAVGADPRAYRVAAIRERARYGGDVTAAATDEAVELVDELRGERRPSAGDGADLAGS